MTDLLVRQSPQRLKGLVPLPLVPQASHLSLSRVRIRRDDLEVKETFPSLSQVTSASGALPLMMTRYSDLRTIHLPRFFLKIVSLL